MSRGGYRPNAGRKPDPNSANQKRLAARAAAKAAEAAAGDRGLTAPDGTKKPEAGADWPFGKDPNATEQPQGDGKSFATPVQFWEYVLQDPEASQSAKQAAAYSLAPYVHAKIAPAAKKEDANARAKKAATGRFGARPAPPRLVHSA